MKIKWLGHSSFLITSSSGVKIITDPYTPGESLSYSEIKETADIVTISHDHLDHNNEKMIKGNPIVLRKSGEVKGINFKTVPAFHDQVEGKQRGKNTIFCFTVDGIRFCHMGDMGHLPDDRQVTDIGEVDVFLVPVGGYFTLEPGDVDKVIENVKPKLVIPMHYQTGKTKLPISSVDAFVNGKKNVERYDSSELVIEPDTLPKSTKIVVLKPAN